MNYRVNAGLTVYWKKSGLTSARSFKWPCLHHHLADEPLAIPEMAWRAIVMQVQQFCCVTDFSRRELELL